MPELKVYTSNRDLPEYYEWQIRSIVRILWHDAFIDDPNPPVVPVERHPQHVVLAEGRALISYVLVVWADVEHSGQNFRMYCIGNVFTFPGFRNRGYGRWVVDTATQLIRADKGADTAILFTDSERGNFYAASGWEHIAGLSAWVGYPDNPERYDVFSMMLFLSARASDARATFETMPLRLPGYVW